MEADLARWLVSPDARDALDEAARQPAPSSLAAAEALRAHWTPEQAAAALTQEALRRRAVTKFGLRVSGLFFTPDGLEQATRPEVAAWRARRLAAAGVTRIVDLGCGIGSDALALVDAGLGVIAVEADPATAVLAGANLRGRAEVLTGDAELLAGDLLTPGSAVFADPARRTARGRTWRVGDFSPSWEFVAGLLDGERVACVKAAPGLPTAFIPATASATWVSHRGDLVEVSLWAGSPAWTPGSRAAIRLPSGEHLFAQPDRAVPVGPVGRYLYEPDPAAIRAGAAAGVAALVDAHALAPGIAYLSGDDLRPTPWATAFEVLEVMPYDERVLRHWVRDQGIGTLEIKVRGIDVDPAVLRRRLRPRGRAGATLVLSPATPHAVALVVRRV